MHVICRTCGGQRVTLWSSRNRTQVQELKSGSQAGSKSLCLLSYMLAYLLFLHLELKHFQTVCVNISNRLQLSSNASTSEASASGQSWAISATPERQRTKAHSRGIWFCRQVTRQRLSCHNCFCKSPKESIKHSAGSQWGQAAESLQLDTTSCICLEAGWEERKVYL